ncbi:MAG: hypothetical protein V4692_14605 [Bdellovibrionota bacterium]
MQRYRTLWSRKEKAYKWLYEFTFGACGHCVSSGCACKDRICQHVAEQAEKKGIRFERTKHPIRFIGATGCVVPPHLRETCTTYLCDKAQDGKSFDRDRYRRLKELCHRLDWKLIELEESANLNLLEVHSQFQLK